MLENMSSSSASLTRRVCYEFSVQFATQVYVSLTSHVKSRLYFATAAMVVVLITIVSLNPI